jgi:hypothetical protein
MSLLRVSVVYILYVRIGDYIENSHFTLAVYGYKGEA